MRIAHALRWIGYALLAVVLVPTVLDVELCEPLAWWFVAFAIFAIAFHVGASAPEANVRRRLAALAVETPCMIAMAALLPCRFGALTLVIVASQAALVLSPVQVGAWILTQTIMLAYFLHQVFPVEIVCATLIGLIGFQGFAAVAVYIARREAEARKVLARTNSELVATRALLEEASRAHERTRIARELHDVLGHDLTALGLQLEIASYVPPEQRDVHVGKAREISARLLGNVREVVGAIRATEVADLGAAVRALVADVPGVAVHLTMPAAPRVDDAERAHCVLRCVQEIVTNTMRHARAQNLWIEITDAGGVLAVDARDDGCGAETIELGHGLTGMRARLEALGGALRVAPAPSFALSAQLPLGASS